MGGDVSSSCFQQHSHKRRFAVCAASSRERGDKITVGEALTQQNTTRQTCTAMSLLSHGFEEASGIDGGSSLQCKAVLT